MVTQDGLVESPIVGRWSEALGEVHGRVGYRLARSEARERARRYLVGLLGQVERKNGWQLAEAIGGSKMSSARASKRFKDFQELAPDLLPRRMIPAT